VPLPRRLGRFNARVTNRLLGPIVTRLPWFGWLEHVGRVSGRPYRTPVMVFRRGEQAVIAMTYGPRTDWARNVIAAGKAVVVERGGRRLRLDGARRVHDASRRLVPWPVRPVLRLLGAADFLVATATVEPAARAGPPA
jgi:deazaflavin-dependent oxidoreductase (nitroreductase family)